MATLTDLYPSYYNVLVNPVVIPSNASTFGDNLDEIKKSWESFSKTGLKDPMINQLKTIFDIYKTGSIDYQALTKSTIGLILSATPLAPVAPFVNMFIGFIWPHLFGANEAPSLFDQIMAAVRLEMQQAFLQFTLNNLTAKMEGMQTALENFNEQTLVAIGQGSKPNLLIADDAPCEPCTSGGSTTPPCVPCTQDLRLVRTLFETARGEIEGALPHFKDPLKDVNSNPTPDWNSDYITMCLPLYTLVATMNLLLYQGYIQFAETWKYTADGSVSPAYSQANIDSLKTTLRRRIVSYTNDLYSTFDKYLPIQQTDSFPYTKGKLNNYIRYTRVMTTQCFDIASLWPMMDSFDYPKSSTTRILSRLIFNDVVGPVEGWKDTNGNKDSKRDDTKLILDMKEMSSGGSNYNIQFIKYTPLRLKSLQFQQNSNIFHSNPLKCYINGYKAVFTGLNGDVSYGTANGGTDMSMAKDLLTDFPHLSRINMGADSAAGRDCSVILMSDTLPFQPYNTPYPSPYGGCSSGCCLGKDNDNRSHNDTDYNDHQIQAINEVTSNGSGYQNYYSTTKTGYLMALLPVDTPMYPSIGMGDNPNDTIHTIPGELFTNIQKYGGPGVLLGADTLLEFINGASASLTIPPGAIIEYKFLNQTANNYQIRARVATTQDSGSLQITIGNTTKTINISNTTTAANDQKGLKGRCGTYMLFPETNSSSPDNSFEIAQGNQTMVVTNNSNATLFVDRFEFIPMSIDNSPFSDPISQVISFDSELEQIIWSSGSRHATEYNFPVVDNPRSQNLTISTYNDGVLVTTDTNNARVFSSSRSDISFNKITITGSDRLARSCSVQGTVSRTNTTLE